jgi:hypothetical protein
MAKTRKLGRSKGADDWVIAIPSYRRAEILRDKTLPTLKSYRIPRDRIHVFVATKEEQDIYKATLDPTTYGHMHIAEPGMAAVRNYITRYFPVGKKIFNIDDDIRGFIEYHASSPRNERPLQDLSKFITEGFRECLRTGFRLFSIYAVPNGYFMKPTHTTDLKYLMGGAWGIINPGKILNITIDDKEDYLRSVMMYLLDGGVIRYNGVACLTQGYGGAGGMQETRTMERIRTSAEAMVKAFPDLVTINLTKKSGIPEVRLRDKRPEGERRFGPAALAAYTLPHIPKRS